MDSKQRIRRIRDTICSIPHGCVAGYGQIAELAGIPRGARQVGYALRNLDEDHDVPWHRVVQASGRIAFDKDSPQFRIQRDRLRSESIAVAAGRVDMEKYRWQPDLDELLWKPTSAWDET